MSEPGVDLKFTRRLDNVSTGTWIMYIHYNLAGHAFIMISASGENIIVIVGGANMHYDDLTKLPNEFKEAIDNGRLNTWLF